MRTREKILFLLLAAILALGAVVYVQSRHDEMPLMRFRSFIFHHPLRNVSEALTAFSESSTESGNASMFGYGAIGLLGVLIAGIAFKSAGNAELRAFKDRLVEMQVGRAEAEGLLQDAIWKEKNARAARELALQELEASASRILALEDQLSDAERLLRKRDAELRAVQARPSAPEPPREKSTEPDLHPLEEELRNTTELLKGKESALAELEKGLTERIDTLEQQLTASEERRKERETEIDALRAELLDAQAARAEAESLRTNDLAKQDHELAAKDVALRELEQALTARIRTLENQLIGQQELLDTRAAELESLKSEMNAVEARFANAAAAKERVDLLLQQALQHKADLAQSKDKALQELQERSASTIHSLQDRLAEREQRDKERDQEITNLKNQLAETGAVKTRAESSLADELRKERQALAAKDAAMREQGRNYLTRIDSITAELREKEELCQARGSEIEGFKSEIDTLTAQLADMQSAKERVETMLQQEIKNKAAALQEKELGFKEAQSKWTAALRGMENRLAENEAALAQRHTELESLASQLADVQTATREKEERLRREMSETNDLARAKELAVRNLEESLAKVTAAAKNEISERDNLLKSRAEELNRLRSEVNAFQEQVKALHAAAAHQVDRGQEGAASEVLTKKLEESSKKILALESLLREKEDLLQTHDGKITRLETELKEKRTELAKHEIAVWQAYEKRALWKQRLSKFGISMKER